MFLNTLENFEPKISLKARLNCPHSYVTDENINLLCDIDHSECDGVLYDVCLDTVPHDDARH